MIGNTWRQADCRNRSASIAFLCLLEPLRTTGILRQSCKQHLATHLLAHCLQELCAAQIDGVAVRPKSLVLVDSAGDPTAGSEAVHPKGPPPGSDWCEPDVRERCTSATAGPGTLDCTILWADEQRDPVAQVGSADGVARRDRSG